MSNWTKSRYAWSVTLPVVVAVLLAGLLANGSARAASDPPFVGWTNVLPPALNAYVPDSSNDCAAGRPTCVTKTIRAMNDHFTSLADACDHNAVFALAYLRTTQAYQQAAQEPNFFSDNPFVAHEDALFAKYYFSAYDNWAAGRRADVPVAWRLTLDAAKARQVTGNGDLLLGMSAHVNRDLPFVLATIGLVTPDGTSRKPDHDKVNVFLNRVVQPLLNEEAARLDPTMDDANSPDGLTYTALMQLLVTWREGAWRNAEALVNAPDASARATVATQIETSAAATATSIIASNSYLPPVTTSASRDAFCATYHG